MKKLFIKTWGCQMNVYDSGRMADLAAPLGYAPTDDVGEADLVILNTCHIREKASEKLFSELGRLRSHQEARAERGGRMLMAVAGCVAQAEGAEIQRRAPFVDMVFGPQSYQHLPEMIARAHREAGLILDTEFPAEPKFDSLPARRSSGVSAFLSVQEGCDKFCTFCVVPYTRGAEYSRPAAAIVTEAEQLVQNGAREIILLGQNVNAFHGEGTDGKTWGLGRLFYRLAEIKNLKRLRYTTSHPRDMDQELIDAHRDILQLMPFLHLPAQSGSDRVLQDMNRKHTVDDYRRIIDRLRAARPDLALSSDFIVGFPGETDQDFEATLALAREVGYAQAYSFKYSRRPGTPAAVRNDQVEEPVKETRLAQLQSLLALQQESFNHGMIGRALPVLFENSLEDGRLFGRSPYMQAVRVAGHARLVGEELTAEIGQAALNSLSGSLELADAA